MEGSISKINPEKASTSKPSWKPPPGDKSIGIDPAIRFYEIEDGDKTKEGEDPEIFIIHD